MRVALLVTCVAEAVDADVADASVAVLRAGGCDVACPPDQTCCGQPAWNAGFADDAARVAGTTVAALDAALHDGAEAVVVPAGSCAAMVRRTWPELFARHGTPAQARAASRVAARTWELTELLPHLDLPPLELAPPTTVAWHHSCHLLRELRQADGAAVLEEVDGVDRVPWAADERCCGFGGLFSVTQPEVSVAMADDKLRSLPPGREVTIVAADLSCLLHLAGRVEAESLVGIRTRHVAQVLADALPPGHRDGQWSDPRR